MKQQHVQRLRKPIAHANKAPLGVEGLESRVYLTCGLAVTAGALTITGDAQANQIGILDDGNANVEVTCDGASNTFSGIQSIKLKSAGSRDVVTYELTGDLVTKRKIVADLGRGDDAFSLILHRHPPAPSEPQTTPSDSLGEPSDPTVTPPEPAVATPRKMSADLTVSVNGGPGSDSIAVEATDIVLSKAKVKITIGGDSADRVGVDASLASGTMGSFDVGKIGLDLASLLVNTKRKRPLPAAAVLKIDSAQGFDTCSFTAGLVTATGCDSQLPL